LQKKQTSSCSTSISGSLVELAISLNMAVYIVKHTSQPHNFIEIHPQSWTSIMGCDQANGATKMLHIGKMLQFCQRLLA
jgi:hypothetical protein